MKQKKEKKYWTYCFRCTIEQRDKLFKLWNEYRLAGGKNISLVKFLLKKAGVE